MRGHPQGSAPTCRPGAGLVDRPWPRCGADGLPRRARRCCWSSTSSSSGSSPGATSEETELVAALRQCDGEHVQAIVPGPRRLLDGRDPVHARPGDRPGARTEHRRRRPLRPAACPQGAGGVRPRLRRPARAIRPSSRATRRRSSTRRSPGWPRTARSISVRLALFAEMVKGKPWTPATLREVGGMDGVGVTFLEETFSSRPPNPEHRLAPGGGPGRAEGAAARDRHRHQGPDASATELREASGYADRPRDFDDLIRILDRRAAADHADRSRGLGRRGVPAHVPVGRGITSSRTTTSFRAARVADAQAAGDAPGPGRAAAGRARPSVE